MGGGRQTWTLRKLFPALGSPHTFQQWAESLQATSTSSSPQCQVLRFVVLWCLAGQGWQLWPQQTPWSPCSQLESLKGSGAAKPNFKPTALLTDGRQTALGIRPYSFWGIIKTVFSCQSSRSCGHRQAPCPSGASDSLQPGRGSFSVAVWHPWGKDPGP